MTLGMPRYEVMHLEIQPSNARADVHGRQATARAVLYAATHSQGIWRMKLNGRGHH